jgi:hypothetical protein
VWKLCVMLVVLAACEGPAGPMGPAGPQGPQGPQGLPGAAGAPGVGTRATFVQTIGLSRSVTVELPTAVGTDPTKIPALSCYVSSDGQTWLGVNDGYSGTAPYCGVQFNASSRWVAVMNQGPAGWFAAFVVVY